MSKICSFVRVVGVSGRMGGGGGIVIESLIWEFFEIFLEFWVDQNLHSCIVHLYAWGFNNWDSSAGLTRANFCHHSMGQSRKRNDGHSHQSKWVSVLRKNGPESIRCGRTRDRGVSVIVFSRVRPLKATNLRLCWLPIWDKFLGKVKIVSSSRNMGRNTLILARHACIHYITGPMSSLYLKWAI